MRNRIQNGGMVIDQRNAGASVTPAAYTYTLDRWALAMSQASKFTIGQNLGSVTPPVGFSNYLGLSTASAVSISASDYFFIRQYIEGFNFADLNWGTANAKTITLSFWVRSSLTGTFGGVITNSASNRSYPFSYTISAANTWEQKSITIAGDTTGTWVGATNGVGCSVIFGLGVGSTFSATAGSWVGAEEYSATGATSVVGTNGATFYLTGCQLEVGTQATSFEYRQYGTELALCQRYYFKSTQGGANAWGSGYNLSTTNSEIVVSFPVSMRISPTALETDGTAGNYAIQYLNTATACSVIPSFANANQNTARVAFTVASGLTAGQGSFGRLAGGSAFLAWSAEL
jgi:hypothetical protein